MLANLVVFEPRPVEHGFRKCQIRVPGEFLTFGGYNYIRDLVRDNTSRTNCINFRFYDFQENTDLGDLRGSYKALGG